VCAFHSTALQPYFRQIVVTLLTRMQQNKTNTYVYYFVYFLLYLLAINVSGLTPDYLIQTVDEIQPGYDTFSGICPFADYTKT
jgi:exportin-2 (importin alpha re-exporter)